MNTRMVAYLVLFLTEPEPPPWLPHSGHVSFVFSPGGEAVTPMGQVGAVAHIVSPSGASQEQEPSFWCNI